MGRGIMHRLTHLFSTKQTSVRQSSLGVLLVFFLQNVADHPQRVASFESELNILLFVTHVSKLSVHLQTKFI